MLAIEGAQRSVKNIPHMSNDGTFDRHDGKSVDVTLGT